MRVGAARFVAGETLDECVGVLRQLNDAGLHANTTLLGEAIPERRGRRGRLGRVRGDHRAARLREAPANVALKLTHLGLSFDEEAGVRKRRARLTARAGELGTFVRIDMEQSEYVEVTLGIYERLRDAGHDSVGTVLQSYLYRTSADLERLLPRAPNLRIVKGAYLEPDSIAYPERPTSTASYLELVERGLRGGRLHRRCDARRDDHPQSAGVRDARGHPARPLRVPDALRRAAGLQRSIAAEGYKVLVASPFGPDWYPYLMRRLAERPANLGFFLKNLVRR